MLRHRRPSFARRTERCGRDFQERLRRFRSFKQTLAPYCLPARRYLGISTPRRMARLMVYSASARPSTTTFICIRRPKS